MQRRGDTITYIIKNNPPRTNARGTILIKTEKQKPLPHVSWGRGSRWGWRHRRRSRLPRPAVFVVAARCRSPPRRPVFVPFSSRTSSSLFLVLCCQHPRSTLRAVARRAGGGSRAVASATRCSTPRAVARGGGWGCCCWCLSYPSGEVG
jgi:hypothetical protein